MNAETTDWRTDVASADASAKAAEQMAQKLANTTGIDLGTVVPSYGGTVAVTAGVKTIEMAVPGAKVGDRVYVHPTSVTIGGVTVATPDSVLVQSTALVTAADKVKIWLLVPAVIIGTTLRIPLRLVAQRPQS